MCISGIIVKSSSLSISGCCARYFEIAALRDSADEWVALMCISSILCLRSIVILTFFTTMDYLIIPEGEDTRPITRTIVSIGTFALQLSCHDYSGGPDFARMIRGHDTPQKMIPRLARRSQVDKEDRNTRPGNQIPGIPEKVQTVHLAGYKNA